MKPDNRRSAKYGAKVRGDVAKLRLDRYGTHQKAGFAGTAGRQEWIEKIVKTIITKGGVYQGFNHFYMDFGKKLVQLKNRFKGETLYNEVRILEDKWASRGLTESMLDEIKDALVQGWRAPAPPPVGYFRLDVSLLDGPDTLT